jgi:hypothetical protein
MKHTAKASCISGPKEGLLDHAMMKRVKNAMKHTKLGINTRFVEAGRSRGSRGRT